MYIGTVSSLILFSSSAKEVFPETIRERPRGKASGIKIKMEGKGAKRYAFGFRGFNYTWKATEMSDNGVGTCLQPFALFCVPLCRTRPDLVGQELATVRKEKAFNYHLSGY